MRPDLRSPLQIANGSETTNPSNGLSTEALIVGDLLLHPSSSHRNAVQQHPRSLVAFWIAVETIWRDYKIGEFV